MTNVPPAFVSIGMSGWLAGGAIAGLPIVIHLLHRRRFKQVDWAAMEWLLEAIRKRSRKLMLEQWLLLAVRTLLLVAIMTAMAKPVLNAAGLGGVLSTDKPVTHTVLAFDNSLSMQYGQGSVSRWERAKKLAQQVLEDGGKGDLASVVVLGSPPSVLVREPSNNLVEVSREIDGIRPHHGAASLDAAVDQISALLQTSRVGRKRVVLVTDMQKTLWTGGGKGESNELNKKLQALAGVAKDFVVLDVSEPSSPNTAVIQFEQIDQIAAINRPARFRAVVANYSDRPVSNALVEFVVDGQVEANQRVDLRPGGEPRAIAFDYTFREPGERAVEVRVGDDGLKLDNRRFLSVRVREALKVLLIDGQPSGEPEKSETYWLKDQLALDEPLPIQTAARPESDLLETKFDDWDAVFLCNVAQLTATESAALRDYLRRGGAVAFFMGSQINIPAYNQILYDNGKGVLPVRLIELKGEVPAIPTIDSKFFTFDPLEYKNPPASVFAGASRAGLLTARIFRYMKMAPGVLPDGSKRPMTVGLGFAGGDPAVVFADVERGRVAVVATSADEDWHRWPRNFSYMPVMAETLKELVARKFRRTASTVGEPAEAPLPRAGFDVSATLTPPGGTPAPLRLEDFEGVGLVKVPATDVSGFYSVALGAPLNTTMKFAVNPPASESDLARYSREDLKAMFPGWSFVLSDKWEGDRGAAQPGLATDDGFYRWFLWFALIAVFAETFLAWRAGHHRK